MWMSEDNFLDLVLFFHLVGPSSPTGTARLGSRHIFSHLAILPGYEVSAATGSPTIIVVSSICPWRSISSCCMHLDTQLLLHAY